MPVSIATISALYDKAAFRRHVYDGATYILQKPCGMDALNALLQQDIEAMLPDCDPEYAHYSYTTEDLVARANSLKDRVRRSSAIYNAFAEALARLGLDPENTALDCVALRVQLPRHIDTGQTLSPHRDTWGSNVMSQINWWAPVMPVTPEKTLLIYPGYFGHPVANTSEGWDYKTLKDLPAGQQKQESNLLPIACDSIPLEEGIAIAPDPGDLYAFSGAQLHASVPNSTDTIRYSLEARTFDIGDEQAGHGAPNVDGASARTAYNWFRRLSDGEKTNKVLDNQ
jgi:hypothetical protein